MHLSLLSDAPASGGDVTANAPRAPHGRAPLEGVMRGIVFLAAISVPLCLAIVTVVRHATLIVAPARPAAANHPLRRSAACALEPL
jgi:hypothetical protein